jgi:hypothetical protein
MPAIPGLRSPHSQIDRLVYVGRMFDKIRLHARGELPAAYHGSLGKGLDLRAATFLRVDYATICQTVLTSDSDETALAALLARGGERNDNDCMIWSRFMQKLGWRDDRSEFLRRRVIEDGFAENGIETFFDLIEIDEERPIGSHGN